MRLALALRTTVGSGQASWCFCAWAWDAVVVIGVDGREERDVETRGMPLGEARVEVSDVGATKFMHPVLEIAQARDHLGDMRSAFIPPARSVTRGMACQQCLVQPRSDVLRM